MKKLEYIARIHTDFPTKFGIPRQSGLVSTKGTIVFEPEYRKEEALKGLEEYSDLGIFRGGQGELESDGTSAETWRE